MIGADRRLGKTFRDGPDREGPAGTPDEASQKFHGPPLSIFR
jgi:hypothetical protein